ncbi:NAC domain-containing protein 21/22-like isoform X1 [Zingiber officinale]|uniref:NAC domain-containing protein 21/22-like isoform X1 n=2 Tax=Zingiber officinale TaxID=94328 RepID=UPI001C4B79EF|nr:NAC domain-containing protein 21/22-like isoform X1 [Zingiber officinale]
MWIWTIPCYLLFSWKAAMSFLSMVEAELPPGFRFHPRDDELICDYLAVKRAGNHGCPMMVDVDPNKCEPWDFPATAFVGGNEWYFFSLLDRKYATGQRKNRATVSGYWKATGKDRSVTRNNVLVGMRKTLVFYQGRAPKGTKTEWVMHEYRMEDYAAATQKMLPFKEDWVLCRVFYKGREMSAKANKETSQDDQGSMPLPPLLDYTTTDQTPFNLKGFEQVPCFSSITPSRTPHVPTVMPHLPNLSSGLNQFTGDRKLMKSVVSHLGKLEGDPKQRMAKDLVSEECLGGCSAQGDLPPAWVPFGDIMKLQWNY